MIGATPIPNLVRRVVTESVLIGGAAAWLLRRSSKHNALRAAYRDQLGIEIANIEPMALTLDGVAHRVRFEAYLFTGDVERRWRRWKRSIRARRRQPPGPRARRGRRGSR